MRVRRSGLLGAALAAISAVALLAGGTAQAQTQAQAQSQPRTHYFVPYTFAAAIPAAADAYATPPGANKWSCKPSAAHPEPVVLAHGLTGNMNDNWQTFSPLLANEGYCVYALTYGVAPGTPFPLDQVGGLTTMESSAQQLAAFVRQVLTATGASKVDILGHSEGTQMPDYYVKNLGGAATVDKYVSLAPLWHGTNPAGLASVYQFSKIFGFDPVINGVLDPVCGSCRELLAGSDYYAALGNPVVPGVTYTNIVTRYDELVQPYSNGIQAGMHNITLQDQCGLDFSEHFAIAADPVAAADVLNALDPAHPRTVPCVYVPPFVG